jgi:hypothetical protein
MTRIGLFPALALTLAAPLAAQQVNPAVPADHASWNRGLVHYGKWVSAALAVTFTGLGAHEYASSDQAFSHLLDICRATPASCALGPSGTYVTPTNGQLYQTSIDYERRARVRLLAGQASLLLAAGLFLADRGRHANEPDNIPYHVLAVSVEPQAGGARVGVRVTF